ncbi:MAG: 50S ribosomal protein L30 [Nitrospirae bacterium]|nr:MAG: 50S ribosomal protein L30 [Nitrospirota bacterium]
MGRPKKHKKILSALGLKRPNKSVIKKDDPSIRGMINKVSHLVEVSEL